MDLLCRAAALSCDVEACMKASLSPSGSVSEPLEAVEDQIEPELELFRVVVAGLHGVLDDHLGEMRVLGGGELPEDVLRDRCIFLLGVVRQVQLLQCTA